MDTAPLRLSAALCIEPPSTRLLNKHGIPKEKKQPAVIPGLAEQRGNRLEREGRAGMLRSTG